MNTYLKLDFYVDKENKKINVQRAFEASIANVWEAWTDSRLLDQWWAPHPWKAITKTMNFREGGLWLYAMQGPDGSKMWSRFDYKTITPLKNFTTKDAFCDSEGIITSELPGSIWNVLFTETEDSTMVHIELSFNELADLEKILETGFKEGFISALGNLDTLLAA
ncbi:MAG: SRPBCC domain-containing protein [Cytophagales bacterium]|nr:SRPBCC domain-containing protein [Cytophaga sp.]